MFYSMFLTQWQVAKALHDRRSLRTMSLSQQLLLVHDLFCKLAENTPTMYRQLLHGCVFVSLVPSLQQRVGLSLEQRSGMVMQYDNNEL